MVIQPTAGGIANDPVRRVDPPSPVQVRPEPEIRAAPQPAPAAAAQTAPPQEVVAEAVRQVNTALKHTAIRLEIRQDEDTGKTVVTLSDHDTGELIRQIPSEEALAIARSLSKLQGLLLRQQA